MHGAQGQGNWEKLVSITPAAKPSNGADRRL